MSIVVTGATGHLGRHVVEELLRIGVPAGEIVATGRSLEKVADLTGRGVRSRLLDHDDPESLRTAFSPGDAVLLVSGNDPARRPAQHRRVIEAAGRAGVARLAYTSLLAADLEDNPLEALHPGHLVTERRLRDSGIPFVVLRNGWYTENYGETLAQAAATGVVLSSTAGGRVASATRADLAAAAAAVLTGAADDGAVLELSGDLSWTFDEFALTASELLDREVRHLDLSPAEHRAALIEAGVHPHFAGLIVSIDYAIGEGALALSTHELSGLIGRPTTSLRDGLRPLAPPQLDGTTAVIRDDAHITN